MGAGEIPLKVVILGNPALPCTQLISAVRWAGCLSHSVRGFTVPVP